MKGVACLGLESKLIHCSHRLNTNEDIHSDDIKINCVQNASSETQAAVSSEQSSSFLIPVIFLSLALGICIPLLIVGAVYIVYKHRKRNITQKKLKKASIYI